MPPALRINRYTFDLIMSKILLLYDTTAKDLARDFKDLLDELNIGPVCLIPSSPDKGLTLENKEEYYLKDAEGAIFIITPGSERLGSLYPSPSVSHEMGQLKQKFRQRSKNVIYLVDKECNLPAIDQKSYILFKKTDIRSVLESITSLLKNLKDAGLYRATPIPTETKTSHKEIDFKKLTKEIGSKVVNVLFDISNRLDGSIPDKDFNDLLRTKYNLNIQDINFTKKDMEKYSVVSHSVTGAPYYIDLWLLSDIGWRIVRLEAERRKKEMPQGIGLLSSLLLSQQTGLPSTSQSGLLGTLLPKSPSQPGLLESLLSKISSNSPSCPNCSTSIKKIYMSPIPTDFVQIENATHKCTKCGYKTKI